MKRNWLLTIFAAATAACATTPPPARPVSGVMEAGAAPAQLSGLNIGLVADSQLQTRGNYTNIRWYRGRLEDGEVWVSIRPPALDWSARSLLRSHLRQLHAAGARAIFYLGDGANNGCHDEFARGFDSAGPQPRPGEEGVLAILDEFRRQAGIPVYFIIGNHDFLGAGSTSVIRRREIFCQELRQGPPNRALTKFEVIRYIDAFNRGNSAFGDWTYRSSLNPGTEALCEARPARQHRAWGCYLAATVDYRGSSGPIQFLLLDTNDWVNVTESRIFNVDQEGLRGAMSFGPERGGIPSQTGWFQENAAEHVPMRVALTHYDVVGLRKNLPILGRVSRQSQEFMNLFTRPGWPRTANQNGGYVISAHTHNPDHRAEQITFSITCDPLPQGCAPRQWLSVDELNIGSTTDHSSYSTFVTLSPSRHSAGSIYYERVNLNRDACRPIYSEIANFTFPNPFYGTRTGWGAIGINVADRHNYREFGYDDLHDLWRNLDSYAGEDADRANCIGLFAAALEKGVNPYTGRGSYRGAIAGFAAGGTATAGAARPN